MATGTVLTSGPVESQAERIARLKRAELVAAAIDELVDTGWRGLRMQAVAARVGVSRQTVYNTFGSRDGLAVALVEHLTDSFLDGFEAAFDDHADDRHSDLSCWRHAVRYLLDRGSDDQALRAMLGADTGDDFLELLTSRSGPLVQTARRRIADIITCRRTQIDPSVARAAAEIVTRLALSHIVQPVDVIEDSAEMIAVMMARYLDGEYAS